jgi:hypothetical protein
MVAALATALGGPVLAQSDSATQADRSAYQAAMKCFVVVGMLVGDAKDNGKPELSADYDTKARRSFDFAVQLGHKIGLSGEEISEDFGLAQSRELPKLVANKSYFRSEAATCKALGLL